MAVANSHNSLKYVKGKRSEFGFLGSVNSVRHYELFIKPKKCKGEKQNCKGDLPLIYKLHIQWGLFHNIIKLIVVKYNTAEIDENLIF